ncbi:MAG: LPS assembly lipoprotein LptE [Desulfobacterales bacterium]
MMHVPPKSISGVSVLLILICVAACGYHFSGGGDLPEGIQTVSIGIFENRSGETGIETLLTNDLVNQFTRFENIRIVDRSEAEARLTGTIKNARIRTIAHKSPTQPAERRITLFLDVELRDPEGKKIWSANDISASDAYDVAPEKWRTEQNKKSAIAVLSERVAERIYYRLTDRF